MIVKMYNSVHLLCATRSSVLEECIRTRGNALLISPVCCQSAPLHRSGHGSVQKYSRRTAATKYTRITCMSYVLKEKLSVPKNCKWVGNPFTAVMELASQYL